MSVGESMNLALCTSGELFGGVEQFVYTYAQHLSKATGIRVVVVLFCPGDLLDRLADQGIETYLMEPRFKYDLLLVQRLACLFRDRSIDVVHTHGYKANVFGGLAARWAGCKAMKTEHGVLESNQRWWKRLKMKFNLALDARVSAQCFGHIVFVTKGVRDANAAFYRRHATSVIYNGIPDFSLDPNVRLPRTTRDSFYIGVVGRLTDVKGHRFLLEAMRILKDTDIRLFVFGKGPLERELQAFVWENQLTDRVSFMGFRSNVHDYLPSLDVFVLPSLQEGFPYAMLECLSVGVPVIASSVGGVREVFEDGMDCIFVPPADSSALARAIMDLFRNPDRRRCLAAAATKKVKAQFTIDQMAASYLKVYRGLPPTSRLW
jgi:glycosyltransferase involved in cell wall biosynthesis